MLICKLLSVFTISDSLCRSALWHKFLLILLDISSCRWYLSCELTWGNRVYALLCFCCSFTKNFFMNAFSCYKFAARVSDVLVPADFIHFILLCHESQFKAHFRSYFRCLQKFVSLSNSIHQLNGSYNLRLIDCFLILLLHYKSGDRQCYFYNEK